MEGDSCIASSAASSYTRGDLLSDMSLVFASTEVLRRLRTQATRPESGMEQETLGPSLGANGDDDNDRRGAEQRPVSPQLQLQQLEDYVRIFRARLSRTSVEAGKRGSSGESISTAKTLRRVLSMGPPLDRRPVFLCASTNNQDDDDDYYDHNDNTASGSLQQSAALLRPTTADTAAYVRHARCVLRKLVRAATEESRDADHDNHVGGSGVGGVDGVDGGGGDVGGGSGVDNHDALVELVARARAATTTTAATTTAATLPLLKQVGSVVHRHAQEIIPRVWLGNFRAANDVDFMDANDVTHVVVCIPGEPRRPDRFAYKVVPVDDSPACDISKHFDAAADFIDDCLEATSGALLIHCGAGLSRAPTILTAYLIRTARVTALDALAFVRRRRQQAMPNNGFLTQLLTFERRVLEQR
eukprot:GHVU01042411.1.p1 GENE.GHVU01042411.1~~GHVU01042411.1.p1  ORF type:complete len:415 (-),score=64.94 GHVU01042411.1:181-1425(-)